jgi:hypothetical protein
LLRKRPNVQQITIIISIITFINEHRTPLGIQIVRIFIGIHVSLQRETYFSSIVS